MAGAALFPQAAMRSAGAVRDFSDSSLIHRMTRGRSWIAVLCALLGGIVALNVLSLSLTAGSGRTSLQIDELKTDVSSLQAQIEERLSAVKVEAEAARLGLANPDPRSITFLSASDADARRVAHLLATDGFLLAPSQPSSYPEPGTTYAPVPTTSAAATTAEPTTTPPATTTGAPATTTPTTTGGTAGARRAGEQGPLPAAPSGSTGARPGESASRAVMRGIDRRLGLLFCGFLLIFSFAFVRSFWLQGDQGGTLRAEARSQQVTRVTIPGERGRVLDRNGKVLATSEDAADVVATPYQGELGETALRLHEVLGEPTTDLGLLARRSQFGFRVSRAQG